MVSSNRIWNILFLQSLQIEGVRTKCGRPTNLHVSDFWRAPQDHFCLTIRHSLPIPGLGFWYYLRCSPRHVAGEGQCSCLYSITSMPCVYLFNIGKITELRKHYHELKPFKKGFLFKWGRTNDLKRRTWEHIKNKQKSFLKTNGLIFQSQVSYLIPIFGMILGYIFLKEMITPKVVVSLLAVLVGLYFVKKADIKKNI